MVAHFTGMVPLQSPCKTENNDAPSVVEASTGGGVELEEVMFVGAHKTEGPE